MLRKIFAIQRINHELRYMNCICALHTAKITAWTLKKILIIYLAIKNFCAYIYFMRHKIIFAPLFELKFIKMQADMASYSRLQHTALWMQAQLNGGFLNMSPLKTIKLYRLHSAAISDGQYIDILNWMSLNNNA